MSANSTQKKQREESIRKILSAADRLKKSGAKLSFRAIANEAEVSVSTVTKPEIKAILLNAYLKDLSSDAEKRVNNEKRIEYLNRELKKAHNANVALRSENSMLREKNKRLEADYRYLLVRCTLNDSDNVISIE